MELLECEQMLQSNLQLPLKLLSFWRWQGIVYVTGLRDFEQALMKEGFSEEQEINMHKTLTSCGLELREVIPIVRLFHEAAGSRGAENDAAHSVPEELRRQLKQELRKEVQAELDEKEERQRAARAALEARRQAAQREREEAQQALEAQQREAERATLAVQEAERAKATRRAQEEARLAQRNELERAVAEAVQAERAEAERRSATAVEEALRHEEAARAVQAVKEADEKQRRDAARALKAEAQQRLAERELQQQAQFVSALEIQDAQHRAVLAAQEAQHRAALEAAQAEYRALLRAQEEREREAALLAESAAADAAAGHREVYHALLAEKRTVGTVVEREDPEVGAPTETTTKRANRRSAEASWAEDAARRARKADAARAVIAKAAALLCSRGVQPSTAATAAVRSEEPVDSEDVSTHGFSGHMSEVSSVDGDDASEDAWDSLNDDAAEFSDEISSASEGPRDPAEVDTSREDVSSDDILGAASDSDSRGFTPSAVIPARSQDRQQVKSSESPPPSIKAHKQGHVRQCIQLCPAQGDTPASEVAFHVCSSGVHLYADSSTTEQLTDRVDEFLSLPGMRAVVHWLSKHFTLIAFQAALPTIGRHRAPVFRGEGWDIMLNFSGACWDAEMMSDALRLCLSGISVAEIVMNDRF
jgi:hypothetical protein